MRTVKGRGGAARLGGSFLGTITHQWSPNLYLELSTSLLLPQVLGSRIIYQLDDDTSLQLATQSASLFAPPTLDVSIFRLLYPTTTSYITYKTGFYTLGPWGESFVGRRQDQSALVLGLTSQTAASPGVGAGGWTGEVEVGPGDMGCSADWSRKVLGGEVDLKIGGRLGSTELKGWVSGARKVSEHIRITLMVEGQSHPTWPLPTHQVLSKLTLIHPLLCLAQSTTGITFKIRFFRLGQSVTLPILITRVLNAQTIVLSALVPCAAYTALHHLYLAPRKRTRAAKCVASLLHSLSHPN